jgi:hypothetical protein
LEGIGDALDMDFSYAFNHAKDDLLCVFGYYYNKYGESKIDSHVTECDAEISDTPLTAHLWKRAKGKENVASSQRWNPNAELNHYLSTNFVGTDRALRDEKVKLLEWWRDHMYSFHVLSHFARDILVIPVSTISSEATFSTIGRIIEEQRSSLAPKVVDAATCLKDWNRVEDQKQHNLRILRLNVLMQIWTMIKQ